MEYSFAISGKHYNILRQHLYPGDGKEAVAIALCGRLSKANGIKFLVHEITLIPYSNCIIREPDIIKWSTEGITPILEKAAKNGFSLLKIHSHPTGFASFSMTDDNSDRELFESVFGWMNDDYPHLSAIMLPDCEIFGRVFNVDMSNSPIKKISIAGDDLHFWPDYKIQSSDEFSLRTTQAFGIGTTNKLKMLKVTVAGCSGTGSPLIEQLTRLGVGHLVLIDPDVIEKRNLNRITNSTMDDAISGRPKVAVLKKSIEKIGLGTKVRAYPNNLYDSNAIIKDIADSDVIFGCVDSIDGRHLLNQIATFYLIPYFDIGIKLISDRKGGINQIMGTVHYLQPGGSSLMTRGLYTTEELRAASMYRTDVLNFKEQKKSGYIVDVPIDSPAVVSINTQVASMAVNEFLARIHPFRYDSNSNFAISRISFTDAYIQHENDGSPDMYLSRFIGRGDMVPMLNMPELQF